MLPCAPGSVFQWQEGGGSNALQLCGGANSAMHQTAHTFSIKHAHTVCHAVCIKHTLIHKKCYLPMNQARSCMQCSQSSRHQTCSVHEVRTQLYVARDRCCLCVPSYVPKAQAFYSKERGEGGRRCKRPSTQCVHCSHPTKLRHKHAQAHATLLPESSPLGRGTLSHKATVRCRGPYRGQLAQLPSVIHIRT